MLVRLQMHMEGKVLLHAYSLYILVYTVLQKRTCHYIFDDNFNKNCPITIIFGVLITQIIGHRTIVSFSPQHLFSANILPLKTQNTKIHKFCRMLHLILRKTNLNDFLHTYVILVQVCVRESYNRCSKCRPCARTHAFSLFLHSLTAESITLCCRPFHTSTRRCFSSSTLLKRHSYTRCCMIPHIL